MFHTLRKIVIVFFALSCTGLAIGAGAFVYQKRAVFDPLVDYLEVRKLPEGPSSLEEISGQVTKVMEDYSFQLKDDRHLVFNLRLVGMAPLATTNRVVDPLKDEIEARCREFLNSKPVRVRVTYMSPARTGLGLVYVGDTNINAALVEEGLAKVKRDYLRGLPRNEQYALVRAERHARESRRGLWDEAKN